MSGKGDEVRSYILDNVRRHPQAIGAVTAERFGISRQAVNRHIAGLVDAKLLHPEGKTKGRRYSLVPVDQVAFALELTDGLEEHQVWDERLRDHLLPAASENVSEVCFYGFTEMFNNAIDHSEGSEIGVRFERTAADVTLWVVDNGVGIFNKIASALDLPDLRQSLLELSKGKFTTDPDRHTGEGIFFTSRVFDEFVILSAHLSFLHRHDGEDWLFEDAPRAEKGTAVMMQLGLSSERTLKGVFDQFSGGEENEYGFTKTHVPLKLAQSGESNLVSRSQAKRVLTRFDRFDEVWLDFEGVKFVGQAFADEIFRVFARQNPRIKLVVVNANRAVEQMIERAKSHEPSGPRGT